MENMEFSSLWCYLDGEDPKTCPICKELIINREIAVEDKRTVYHRECILRKTKERKDV